MEYEQIVNKLSDKIKKNCEKMGDKLLEYTASCEGIYFDRDENFRPLAHIFSWTQSFFTGMAYWSYLWDKDDKTLSWLYSFYQEYYDKVFKTPMDTMHDLGFMYSPYAVALYNITGDIKMKELAIKAADELAKRFNPKGGYIRAWGRMDGTIPDYVSEELKSDDFFARGEGRAIVDCMMNIPLLFWVSKETGHPFYMRVATYFADMVYKYFIREDYSVCHAYIFNPETGEALGEENSCGYGIGSHWARGTSWAIYGFILAYDYTKDEKYLEASVKICEKFIDECGGKMPAWDFRVPDRENADVDTSAVAVTLCAAIEILKHTDNPKIAEFEKAYSEKILDYVDFDMKTDGLLKEQNGKKNYTSYGDYYLMEYFCTKALNKGRVW